MTNSSSLARRARSYFVRGHCLPELASSSNLNVLRSFLCFSRTIKPTRCQRNITKTIGVARSMLRHSTISPFLSLQIEEPLDKMPEPSPKPFSKEDGAVESSHQEDPEGVRVEIVQGSVALDIARRTNPPQPWSRQMRKLYLFLTVAYLCSALNGMENVLTGKLKVHD